MLIDIVFALLMALALYNGFRKGLIVAVFSVIAFIIGLAAAMKLSLAVAAYIGESIEISDRWLPIISFILVFLVVVFLVRVGAKLIEKTVQMAFLGWANRLGGILLYMALYCIILSIILFYAAEAGLLKEEALKASVTYEFIKPWGPKAIGVLGAIIPWFRDMFGELERFFEEISLKFGTTEKS